tara:strand:- start:456 stop:1631 length:1176 start_codon:yes stop_codon:yes gene_type:complete
MIRIVVFKIILFKFFNFFIFKKNKYKTKKTLLICHTDQIGDFIIFTNILSKIRYIFPFEQWNITLVGLKDWKNLIENQIGENKNKWIDKYIPVNKNKFFIENKYRSYFLRKLNITDYDLVINTNTFRLLLSDLICFSVFARKKICFNNNKNFFQKFFNLFYTQILKSNKEELHEMTIYQNMFSIFNNFQFDDKMEINWDNYDEKKILKKDYTKKPFVLISAVSGNPRKDWPIINFVNLISEIKKDYKIYLCGNNDQKKIIDVFFKSYLDDDVVNIAGKVSLRELAYLCHKSLVIITNDSMVGHMAMALNKPLLCIIPGTDLIPHKNFGNYFPYPNHQNNQIILNEKLSCIGCKWECIYSIKLNEAFPCVSQITYDKVILNYKKLIQKINEI